MKANPFTGRLPFGENAAPLAQGRMRSDDTVGMALAEKIGRSAPFPKPEWKALLCRHHAQKRLREGSIALLRQQLFSCRQPLLHDFQVVMAVAKGDEHFSQRNQMLHLIAQPPASLRAWAIIFSGSTSSAAVSRSKVFKVGFRNSCSINATACRDIAAFCASKFKEMPRFSRSAFNKRATCELIASGIRLTGTKETNTKKFA